MTSTTGRSSRGDRGFTLLELVLVMVLICLALAVAAPSLSHFWRGSQSQNAAQHKKGKLTAREGAAASTN